LLFLGDSTSSDEVKIIETLSKFVANNYPFLSIVYRPHPFQKTAFKRKFLTSKMPSNVILDYEFKDHYFEGELARNEISTKSNLDRLEFLLNNADGVITGGTTSFLEALLFLKPIYLINGSLRKTKVLNKQHFEKVHVLDSVYITEEDEIDIQKFDEFIFDIMHPEERKIDISKLDFYFNLNGKSYMERFDEIINEINAQ
jgi:hypothetical protein